MITLRKVVGGLLVALCILIVIVAVIQRRAPIRVLYAGKDAIYWSQSLNGNPIQRTNAEHALRIMGPPAARDLADVLAIRSKMKDRLFVAIGRNLPSRMNWRLLRLTGVLEPQLFPAMAARGLEVLGPAARAVVPEMEAAIPVSNPDVYIPLIHALAQIEPEGFWVLGRILRQGESARQGSIANLLRSLGTNGLPLLPDLIYVITNRQPAAGFAALAISAMGESALPSITSLLSETDKNLVSLSILTLKGMGASAEPALPNLLSLAASSDHDIRAQAIRAIGSIDPNQSRCLTVLKAAARDPDPSIRLAAVDALQNTPNRVWRDHPLFHALVNDPDPPVRERARKAFGEKNPLNPKD